MVSNKNINVFIYAEQFIKSTTEIQRKWLPVGYGFSFFAHSILIGNVTVMLY